MQHKKTAIVKKTYTKGSNNKIFGIVDHQTLNTILGVLAVTGVGVLGYKVFFSNGKKQEEPPQPQQQLPQQQPQQQFPQQIQQPPQQIVPNQSPEMIRNYLAGGPRGRLMVQDNASADIANNVAMIANTGQQQVFSEQPPNTNVKTKEQVMKDRVPPHGDNYYNALSGFKSPFLLSTPKPAEVSVNNEKP